MYDVAIIGAGPAGATLARLLGAELRVLLVDRRSLEWLPLSDDLEKCCGGLLAPAAQKELARQGLGVPGAVASGPQLFAVRCEDGDSGLRRLYSRSYVNVDRDLLDRWLVSLVGPQVDRGFGWTARSVEQGDDGAMVRFDTPGGGSVSALARMVVGADGAASIVRRGCFPHVPSAAGYVAVQGQFESANTDSHYGAFFDSSITDHYGWTIPKSGTTLVGAAFPRRQGVPDLYEAFVRRVRRSGFALGTELGRSSSLVSRPTTPAQLFLGSDRVALLGEAAGLISPSSAEGISYALRSAASLAEALVSGTNGALYRYRMLAAPLVLEVCVKMVKARLIGSPVMRAAVLRSGAGALIQDSTPGYRTMLGEILTP